MTVFRGSVNWLCLVLKIHESRRVGVPGVIGGVRV